jgi:hypothetical protein
MEQLGLEPAAEQPPAVDPWVEARAAATPGAIVLRVINHVTGKECFVEIPRTKANVDAGLDLYDGATVTHGSPQPFVVESNIELATDHAGAPA